jgi:NAD+ kinase
MYGDKSIRKILVVYKKSSLQLAQERKNRRILELLEKGDASVSGYQAAHDSHIATLQVLKKELSGPWFDKVSFRYRANAKLTHNYDLVIAVGGDGTFLWASKITGNETPIIGINSAPDSSVGFFTYTDRSGIPEFVSDICEDVSLTAKQTHRLQLKVNGKKVQDRILNDVFFAAAHPAGMTRYVLWVPSPSGPTASSTISEDQKSSGMWISTAAGSTGANLSAGGWILPLEDERGQYVVREPMRNFVWGTEHSLTHGFFRKDKNQSLKILCKTRKAVLACDGTTTTIPVTTGDIIEVSHSEDSLCILGK